MNVTKSIQVNSGGMQLRIKTFQFSFRNVNVDDVLKCCGDYAALLF